MIGILGSSPAGAYYAGLGLHQQSRRGPPLGATSPVPLGPKMCANPLPPGRYAITIYDQPVGAVRGMHIWTEDTDGVTVDAAQRADDPSGVAWMGPTAVIFRVSKPAFWNYTIFGCPNVADAKFGMKDLAPAPATPGDWLWQLLGGKPGGGIPTWVYLGLGGIVLVALAPTMFEISKVVELHEEHKK